MRASVQRRGLHFSKTVLCDVQSSTCEFGAFATQMPSPKATLPFQVKPGQRFWNDLPLAEVDRLVNVLSQFAYVVSPFNHLVI